MTKTEYPLRFQRVNNQEFVFCQVRKKFVVLTPEEWVRQHVLYLLNHNKNIGYARMAVERQVKNSNRRFDIVIHDKQTGQPQVLIECKRREEKLQQSTFDQVSQYNQQLNVPYLVITNWTNWMAAKMMGNTYQFINEFPAV